MILRASHAVVLLLACAACSAWQFPEPQARWPRAPALGVPAWDGPPLRPTAFAAVASGDGVYVSVLQSPGRDFELKPVTESSLELLAFTPATGATKVLPRLSWPATPVVLWPSSAPGVVVQQGARAASFDGAAWSELPALPASPLDLLWRVDGQHVVARRGSQLWSLAGGAWLPLTLPAQANVTSAVFGPAQDGRARLVWSNGADGLCTAMVGLGDGVLLDAPVCRSGTTEMLGGDSLNGTPDDFHAWSVVFANVDIAVWRYSVAGGWARGVTTAGRGLGLTPASPGAVVTQRITGTFPIDTLTRVGQGRLTEALFVQSWELMGCDGEPWVCASRVGFMQQVVALDGASTSFVMENVVDGRRSLYVKTLALPHRDGGSCTPACAANQLCVRGSGIANLCVADPAADAR